jgi:hypothetical protein
VEIIHLVPRRNESGWRGHYMRGLGVSTRNNTIAYGYSVGGTASFGAIQSLHAVHVGDVFLFLVGASLPFSIVNAIVTGGFRRRFADEPGVVIALATSFSLFSVAASVGAAALIAWLSPPWAAWLFGPFAFSIVYLCAVGAETAFAAAQHPHGGREDSS